MARTDFPAPGHDHRECLDDLLARARDAYKARGERLTPLREAVLRALAGSHEALGAYDLIEKLAARGRRVAPISVYRVLDSLAGAGLVHRIESRNAFVACHGAHRRESPVLFLVCESCGTVAETARPELTEQVGIAADSARFRPGRAVLEVTGLCRHCAG